MKRNFLTIVIMAFLSVFTGKESTAQLSSIAQLAGKWECIDAQNNRGSIEFMDSGSVKIHFMGESREVRNFSIDFSRAPYWFIFAVKDDSAAIPVKSYLHYVDNNNLKWEIFYQESMGTQVATHSETVLLRRVETDK